DSKGPLPKGAARIQGRRQDLLFQSKKARRKRAIALWRGKPPRHPNGPACLCCGRGKMRRPNPRTRRHRHLRRYRRNIAMAPSARPAISWAAGNLVPDSDEPGERYIANAAKVIRAENPGADIRVVRPFGKPNGSKGRDVCDWKGTSEDLVRLAASAVAYTPSRETKTDEPDALQNDAANESGGAEQQAKKQKFTPFQFNRIKLGTASAYLVKGPVPPTGL